MQIWVYGNSLESTLIAVAVPNETAIKDWAKSNGGEDDMPRPKGAGLYSLTAQSHRKSQEGKI
jgi:hypothetical protein